MIRSASAGPNPIAAIDALLDKLERQVVRSKERPRRVREREHDEARNVLVREADGSVADDGGPGAAEEPGPSVVRIKRFDMVPMFEEDAVTRMEELGHAFFVFLNAENERICVVYRRRDGTYGLIEPVVGGAADSAREDQRQDQQGGNDHQQADEEHQQPDREQVGTPAFTGLERHILLGLGRHGRTLALRRRCVRSSRTWRRGLPVLRKAPPRFPHEARAASPRFVFAV